MANKSPPPYFIDTFRNVIQYKPFTLSTSDMEKIYLATNGDCYAAATHYNEIISNGAEDNPVQGRRVNESGVLATLLATHSMWIENHNEQIRNVARSKLG